MEGAPWNGLFYGFVLEAIVAIGAFVMALGTADFLVRTIAWLVFAAVVVAGFRTLRAAVRLDGGGGRETGRWWFNG